MLNHIDLAGRIVSEPKYKETDTYKLISFTVACDRDFQKGKDKATDFIRCSAFGGTASFIQEYFDKGDMIIVSGRIQVDEDRDAKKSFFSVKVENVYFGGAKKGKTSGGTKPTYDIEVDDGDIPF